MWIKPAHVSVVIAFLLIVFLLVGFLPFNVEAGTVYNWQATTSLPSALKLSNCVDSSGYLFCMSGENNTGYSFSTVNYTQISSSGVGTWQQTESVDSPSNIANEGGSCVTDSGYVYCVGGISAGAATFTAQLSSTGASNWQRTTDYPTSIVSNSCVVYSGFITCIGGNTGSGTTNAVYNDSESGGTMGGTWKSSTNYPVNLEQSSCIVDSGYVYCVGGNTGSATVSDVYYAQLSSTGGTTGSWTSTTSYPTTIHGESCVAATSYIYCIGGNTGSAATNSVYFAPLLSTGGIGAGGWQRSIFPTTIEYESCVYDSGTQNIVCVGGSNGSTVQSNVYYAPIVQPSTVTSTTTTTSTVTPTALSIVQHASGGCSYSCSTTTVSASFSSVSAGDVLVFGVTSYGNIPTSVSDSLGSSITQENSSCYGKTIISGVEICNDYASVYYASLTSTGSDTVTASFPAAPSQADIFIFELSGASLSVGLSSANGTGTTPVSTSPSLPHYSSAFLMSAIADYTQNGPQGLTAGSGFTLLAGLNGVQSGSEYSTSGVSSPTDFPATLSVGGFAETGIVIEPAELVTTATTTTTATSTVTSDITSTTTTTLAPVTSTTTHTSTVTQYSTLTSVSTATSTTTLTQGSTTTTEVVTQRYPVTTTETTTSSVTTTSTVTTTSVPPVSITTSTATVTQPFTSTQTVTTSSVSTQTVTRTTYATSPASILVHAFSSGGAPVSGDQVRLTGPSGYYASASTNSSGEVTFSGLTPGDTYDVSAMVDGVSLSTPTTLSQNGGTAVVVLEPNLATTTTGSSTTSSSGFTFLEIAGTVALAAVIVGGTLVYLLRRPQ